MENPKLIIRNANFEELDQVALLLKEAYQEYYSFMPPEVFQSYLEDIMDVRSVQSENSLSDF